MVRRSLEGAAVLAAAAALACSTPMSPKLLAVPPEMGRAQPPPPVAARSAPGAAAAAAQKMELRGASNDTKYVVRLAEGGRVWEVELPESAGGYEIRVPLAGGPLEQMTQADEEMLADSVKAASGGPDAPAGKVVDAKGAAKKKSYLGSLAKVNELYMAKKYELALIEVVSLEKEYPQDSRILSMKGSLYLKLGKHKLAREAWEKALQINPNDQALAEALRELSSREE